MDLRQTEASQRSCTSVEVLAVDKEKKEQRDKQNKASSIKVKLSMLKTFSLGCYTVPGHSGNNTTKRKKYCTNTKRPVFIPSPGHCVFVELFIFHILYVISTNWLWEALQKAVVETDQKNVPNLFLTLHFNRMGNLSSRYEVPALV